MNKIAAPAPTMPIYSPPGKHVIKLRQRLERIARINTATAQDRLADLSRVDRSMWQAWEQNRERMPESKWEHALGVINKIEAYLPKGVWS